MPPAMRGSVAAGGDTVGGYVLHMAVASILVAVASLFVSVASAINQWWTHKKDGPIVRVTESVTHRAISEREHRESGALGSFSGQKRETTLVVVNAGRTATAVLAIRFTFPDRPPRKAREAQGSEEWKIIDSNIAGLPMPLPAGSAVALPLEYGGIGRAMRGRGVRDLADCIVLVETSSATECLYMSNTTLAELHRAHDQPDR